MTDEWTIFRRSLKALSEEIGAGTVTWKDLSLLVEKVSEGVEEFRAQRIDAENQALAQFRRMGDLPLTQGDDDD